ncbi:hypothetical protein TRVL_05388 [Trypanosoma vivax]|nr:hypothetical protein TRVL_05388 [Trypanosoma vivax]
MVHGGQCVGGGLQAFLISNAPEALLRRFLNSRWDVNCNTTAADGTANDFSYPIAAQHSPLSLSVHNLSGRAASSSSPSFSTALHPQVPRRRTGPCYLSLQA